MDTIPVLNREAALSLLLGREDLLRRLECVFAEDIPEVMDDLRLALARGDLPETVRLAHSIKGQAATIGAQAAAEAAKAVENWARTGGTPSDAGLADVLDRALREILTLITGGPDA